MTILSYLFINDCLSESDFDDRLKLFTFEQQARIRRFKRWEDAHASLFGKLLMLEGFKYFGVPVTLKDLNVTIYGKPYIKDSPITFNISHSGNCVACVLSNDTRDIGVDLEEIKPVDISDFDRVWNDRERDMIGRGDLRVFYNYWTRKEAVVKAEGKGLSIPLVDIDVTGEYSKYGDKLYYFTQVNLREDFIINIVSTRKSGDLTIMESGCLSDNLLQAISG